MADSLFTAFSPNTKCRITFAEVTDSSRELERSHLCGPTAGLLQAEALAAVALLGAETTLPDESVTLRLTVSGPVGGLLVEAGSDGSLRGYTKVKVMNELDQCEELDAATALGDQAQMEVIRSIPGKVLASGIVSVSPASLTACLEDYFRNSQQRVVVVQVTALAYGGFIDRARGIMVECMPDGDLQQFARLAQCFEDGLTLEVLETGASFASICESLKLTGLTDQSQRPLRFKCRCSEERVESLLRALPRDELEEMIEQRQPVTIFCHFCGRSYTVVAQRLPELRS